MRHRTADLEPTAFGGRYTLIRRLAVGGMAEIYLARQAAMAGFEKEVVIKRLRGELADDPKIVEMFLDEARIGALLNHPNIVHVYDVDEHDVVPYIAMEYIVGEELNELCRRGIQQQRFLPIEHAVELIRQAAAGMGYFHAKRGGEGTPLANQPLEIVHLDISPTNLLVTADGTMKVIDFGIARAVGQRSRTDVIPGKLSYMSPEQASRGTSNVPVDHRSDIFSLGIVLYEITVGRRLFRGTPAEIVPKLVGAQIEPPTFARRNYPAALESIVMRALEKHPGDRYQSAYDLADDLETFLRDERLHSGPVRIARYLDMLTHAAGGARRPELVSEAENRLAAGHDDLDFDAHFDGGKPNDGAPSPEQAREWEDQPQPEADVAAALGMELEELRALRTPVPMRPAGMAEISGAEPRDLSKPMPLPDSAEDDEGIDVDTDDEVPAAEPPRRPVTVEEDGDGVVVSDAPARPTPTPAPRKRALTDDAPMVAKPVARPAPAPAPVAQVEAPVIGARMLPTKPPSNLPWVFVGLLVMAVCALVAYIVLK
ncbi:MAG TPA: serine/threonine-protein kinase [Kofleriaceae bacterium]